MAIVVVDHHLKDFDSWFEIFKADPPPAVGRWRVVRGTEDPNRVHVVGEMDATEVETVKKFFSSEHMQKIFAQVNEGSTRPLEFVWLEEVSPE